MPVLQRVAGVFFVGIVAHVWEENRYPGGFSEMIADKLHFTAKSKHFGEAVTMVLVLWIALVPLFFPHVTFLLLAPMLLGVLEAVAHTAMIPLFGLKRPYSPGMGTAVVVLLPISVYAVVHAIGQHLVAPTDWLWALIYMFGGLMVAQRIVVTASGMRYRDFLRNARTAVLTNKDSGTEV